MAAAHADRTRWAVLSTVLPLSEAWGGGARSESERGCPPSEDFHTNGKLNRGRESVSPECSRAAQTGHAVNPVPGLRVRATGTQGRFQPGLVLAAGDISVLCARLRAGRGRHISPEPVVSRQTPAVRTEQGVSVTSVSLSGPCCPLTLREAPGAAGTQSSSRSLHTPPDSAAEVASQQRPLPTAQHPLSAQHVWTPSSPRFCRRSEARETSAASKERSSQGPAQARAEKPFQGLVSSPHLREAMGGCPIQGFLLLSLLGFPACSDTLTCHKGIMLKSGSNFSKTPIEWKSFGTTQSEPGELCQETLLLIDVGEKSLLLGSKGCSNPGHQKIKNVTVYSGGPGMVASSYVNVCGSDLCNKANSSDVLVSSLTPSACSEPGMTRCPVCLDFEGSCSELSDSVFCPRKTGCYTSDLVVKGGGINAIFSIDGCLVSSAKNLLKDQSSVGVFSVVEISDSMTYNSSSNMLVPGTFLAWLLGLGLFLALCLEGFVFLAEPIFLPSLIPAGLPCPPSPDVTT